MPTLMLAGSLIWESGLIRFLRDLINFPDYISAQYEGFFYFLSYNTISFIQLIGIYFPLPMKVKMKVAQSCPTLCNPMDCIIHGILQAIILDWVAFPFSRWSSQPRDRTQVSHIAGRFFTRWARSEAQGYWSG